MTRRWYDLSSRVSERFKKTRITLIVIITLAIICSAETFPQDLAKILAKAYQLKFENEWVRVTKVHYGPREIIPEHAHTKFPVAYKILKESPLL